MSSGFGPRIDDSSIILAKSHILPHSHEKVTLQSTSLFLRSLPFREVYLKPLFQARIQSVFDYPFLPILGGLYHPSNFKAALFRKNKSKAYHHFASAFSECRLFRDGSYFGRTDGKDVHKDANGMIRQEYSTSSTTTNAGDFYYRYSCYSTAQRMLYARFRNGFLLHDLSDSIEIKDVRNDFTTKYSQGVRSTGPMDRLTPKIATVQELSRETSGSSSTTTTLSPQVHILDQLPFSSIFASVMLKDTRKNTNPNDSAFRVFLYFLNEPEYLSRFSSHMQFTLYGKQQSVKATRKNTAFRKKTWNLGDAFQNSQAVTLLDSAGESKSWLRVQFELTIPKHSRSHDQLTQVFFLLSNGNPNGFSENLPPQKWSGKWSKDEDKKGTKFQNILIGMRMEIAPLKPCPNGKKRTHDGKCGCISDPEHRGFYRTCPVGLVSKVTQAPSLPGSNAPGVYTCSCVPKCKGNEQWLGFKNYQCGICPAGQFNFNFSASTNSKVDFDQVGVCLSCESRIPSSSLVWKPTSSKVSCGQSDPKIHGQCEAHCECQAPFKLKTIDGVKVCVPPCLAGDIWDPKKRKCVPCGPKQTSNERRNKCTNCQPQEPNEWGMTFFVVDEKGRRCVRIATYPPCNRSTWYYDVHTRKCESCPSGGAKNDTLTNDIDGFKRYTQCQCPCDNLKVVTKDGHCSAPGSGLDPYCCPAEHQYNWANKQCAPCHESYHKPTHPGGAYCVPRCDYSNKGLVWDSGSKTCVCHDKSKEIVNGTCVPKCKSDEVRVNGACVCPTGQIKINGICEEKCSSAQVKVGAKCYWPVGLGHKSVHWKSDGAPPRGSYLAFIRDGFHVACLVGFAFNGFGLSNPPSAPLKDNFLINV